MGNINDKILKLLREENIKQEEIVSTLIRASEDIHYQLWEKVNVSYELLCNFKDTVWYNLEHIPSGGESKGMSNLRFFGTKVPTLIYNANSSEYISPENVEPLLNELLLISQKWSNEWILVHLFTKNQETWIGGPENPSLIVIYSSNESPSKYGIKKQSFNSFILDSKGEVIQKEDKEVVSCLLEEKLGTYGKEPLMVQLLDKMINSCKKALENKKGLFFDFQTYDYNN